LAIARCKTFTKGITSDREPGWCNKPPLQSIHHTGVLAERNLSSLITIFILVIDTTNSLTVQSGILQTTVQTKGQVRLSITILTI